MPKLSWKTIQVPLGNLKEWDKNPAQISERDAKQLARSLDKFGYIIPFVAAAPKNGKKELPLLDGHQRKAVELSLRHTDPNTLVDVRVPNRPLTEKEKQEAVIRMRSNTGEYNPDALLNWFDGADLLDWGMPQKELESFGFDFTDGSADAEPQIDRAAELLKKWKVKTGDLWQIGEHRLICGDCTDAAVVVRLMDGGRADFTFTDPPYNVGLDYENEESDDLPKDDYIEWCKRWLSFCPDAFTVTSGVKHLLWWELIKPDPQWIISWVKMNGSSQTGLLGPAKWDPILIYGCPKDRQSDVIEINNDYVIQNQVGYKHPGAKPPELWQAILTRFGGATIYEPFCGSGTTLVACQNLNRRVRAIEISPAYCAVTLERMAQAFPGIEIKRVK